jgi:hypothetical protein
MGVSNAAHLALLMVNLSSVVLARFRQEDSQCSVLDLNAWYRGCKYATELIHFRPEASDEDLMVQLFRQLAQLGRSHPPEPRFRAACLAKVLQRVFGYGVGFCIGKGGIR